MSKNRKFVYAIWIIGLTVSILVSYVTNETVPFLAWVLVILISNFLFQGNDLKKRMEEREKNEVKTV
jgi:hypothetical protein